MNVSKCVSGAGSWCRGLMKRDISPVHIVKRCPLFTSDFQLTASPVPPASADLTFLMSSSRGLGAGPPVRALRTLTPRHLGPFPLGP